MRTRAACEIGSFIDNCNILTQVRLEKAGEGKEARRDAWRENSRSADWSCRERSTARRAEEPRQCCLMSRTDRERAREGSHVEIMTYCYIKTPQTAASQARVANRGLCTMHFIPLLAEHPHSEGLVMVVIPSLPCQCVYQARSRTREHLDGARMSHSSGSTVDASPRSDWP